MQGYYLYRCGIETSNFICTLFDAFSINCTVVELKHKIKRRNTIQRISINCTVVELKPGIQ